MLKIGIDVSVIRFLNFAVKGHHMVGIVSVEPPGEIKESPFKLLGSKRQNLGHHL